MQRPVLRPGEVVADRYRVERVLRADGSIVVLAAYDLDRFERVALEVLAPHAARRVGLAERFEREARAASRLTSEHVARVLDVGHLRDGTPYVVREHVDGGDLAAWNVRAPLSVEQAVAFLVQACEAIREAHALGIVHGHLEATSLLCTRRYDGTLAIKVLGLGTPISSERADPRADVRSLGGVLLELVPDAPPALAAAVDRCQDVAELAQALAPFTRG